MPDKPTDGVMTLALMLRFINEQTELLTQWADEITVRLNVQRSRPAATPSPFPTNTALAPPPLPQPPLPQPPPPGPPHQALDLQLTLYADWEKAVADAVNVILWRNEFATVASIYTVILREHRISPHVSQDVAKKRIRTILEESHLYYRKGTKQWYRRADLKPAVVTPSPVAKPPAAQTPQPVASDKLVHLCVASLGRVQKPISVATIRELVESEGYAATVAQIRRTLANHPHLFHKATRLSWELERGDRPIDPNHVVVSAISDGMRYNRRGPYVSWRDAMLDVFVDRPDATLGPRDILPALRSRGAGVGTTSGNVWNAVKRAMRQDPVSFVEPSWGRFALSSHARDTVEFTARRLRGPAQTSVKTSSDENDRGTGDAAEE
jgi:hypothetical protein